MTRDRRTTNPRRVVVGASHRPIQKTHKKRKKGGKRNVRLEARAYR